MMHCMLDIPSISKILIYGGNNNEAILSDLLLFDYSNWEWEVIEKKEFVKLTGSSAVYYEPQ